MNAAKPVARLVAEQLRRFLAGKLSDRDQMLQAALELEPPAQLVLHEGKTTDLMAALAVQEYDMVLTDAPLGPEVHVRAFHHSLGGCGIGAGPDMGVIDSCGRVFGYDGLYVAVGSVIGANLGVNPSLTITALAERAMSLVPQAADVTSRAKVSNTSR